MDYSYRTYGVCSVQINFKLDNDVVSDVEFIGGCNGNLKAISKLVNGMTVDQIEGYLKGNTWFRLLSNRDHTPTGRNSQWTTRSVLTCQ